MDGPLFAQTIDTSPIKVTLQRDGERFYLTRGGEPYVVRGVSGFDQLDAAVAAGATTLRTWGVKNLDEGRLLDEAHKRGLTVLVGLWFGHKRDGFDYSNAQMVQQQFEELSKAVLRYKDHPAVLAWGVGNEAEAHGGEPWEAINQLAQFIHEVDPYHPTVCVLAGSSVERIRAVKTRSPHIDILGINTYNAYANVRKNVREAEWTGPYFITEMGIDGTWHAATTKWKAPLEPASGVKADLYIERYRVLAADTNQCIGIFPFKWGYVPKGTSTWFSLFHEHGEPNAVVDAIHYLWCGQWSVDRAPWVESLTIEGRAITDNLRLAPAQMVTATVSLRGSEAQALNVEWELRPETQVNDAQGTQMLKPMVSDVIFEPVGAHAVRFAAPLTPGPYRLYYFARTPSGKIGTANFPFYVDRP